MTRHESTPKKKPLPVHVVVSPLLFLCCFAVASTMLFNPAYSSTYPETGGSGLTEQQLSGSATSSPSTPSAANNNEPVEDVVIGEYTATSASTEPGRVENLRLAAEAINGAVIEPGQTYSFNEAVGDLANDERYQMASVVYGYSMQEGRGGGSCQVSSALYVAALYANLSIVERYPHSLTVDYVPLGLDATVVYGTMDLRIANDSASPVTISATAEGQSTTVKILGQPLEEGLAVEPTSFLLEYHVAGTPLTYTPEFELDIDLAQTTYYRVEGYREYYRDGEKTDSILLSSDLYVVLDGSTSRLPNNGESEVK